MKCQSNLWCQSASQVRVTCGVIGEYCFVMTYLAVVIRIIEFLVLVVVVGFCLLGCR